MNFHVLAWRAWSILEMTEQISSTVWITKEITPAATELNQIYEFTAIPRKHQHTDTNKENGSVFRCWPCPTNLQNIATEEASGEKWKYFGFKMLLSEKLVRKAGTEHTQKPVLKFQTYSPKKKRMSKTKKVTNPCIPDTIYVISSSVEAEPMEIRSTSSISCFWRE